MERHWKHGFQKNFKNDIYQVEERLQEYDPHLYVMFNPDEYAWMIVDGLMEVGVMRIPQIGFETLDGRVVDHIKRIHTANGFSALHEVMIREENREREYQKKVDEMSEDFAKNMFQSGDRVYSV